VVVDGTTGEKDAPSTSESASAAASTLVVAAESASKPDEFDLDSIINRLLQVRGARPGEMVRLLEDEIRFLCTKARDIFVS